MAVQDCIKTWALPNVLFHITMAYAILRDYGVVLGKIDCLAGVAQPMV